VGQWRRRRNSKSAEKRNKSKVSQKSKQLVIQNRQSAGSALAATIRWYSGVVEGSPNQLKSETSRKSARKRDSQSAKNESVDGSVVATKSRFVSSVVKKKIPVSRKPKQVESQQKSSQYVREKPASQPEVPWRLSQPETSQSAGGALAATIRWVSGIVEGSPSRPKNETSRNSARRRDNQSARNQSVSRKCLAAAIRWDSGVVEGSQSQPKTETSRISARSRDSQSARNQSVSRLCPGGHNYEGWASGVVEGSPSQPKTETSR